MERIKVVGRTSRLLVLWLCAALIAALPAAATAEEGPPYPEAEWAAWGLAASFATGEPIVKFAAYVGVVDAEPAVPGEQPAVLGSLTETLTFPDKCSIRSASGIPQPVLQIDGAGYAQFDGDVYIECQVPSWAEMIDTLAPHLPMAINPECNCQVAGSPVWASADVIIHPTPAGASRLNPLIDASELGFAFSIPTQGTAVRTRISRSNGHLTSPTWVYGAGAEQVVTAQHGPFLVTIANYFNGLSYMPSSGWNAFFMNQVGSGSGLWREPTGQGVTWVGPQSPFTLGTGESTIYIGRSNSTGGVFKGRLRHLTGDPGCFGY